MRLSFRTASCSHEDDTIGTTDTEHSRTGGILEHGNALDFIRVDLGEVPLHTVHQDKRGSQAVVKGAATSDVDGRSILSRLAAGLHRCHTRDISGEHIGNTADRRLDEVLSLNA